MCALLLLSAGASVAAQSDAQFQLISPKQGSVTTNSQVKVVVSVTSSETVKGVSLNNFPMHFAGGDRWTRTLRMRNDFAGKNVLNFTADLGGQSGPSATFFFYYYTSIGLTTEFDQQSALGCNPCSFRDRTGDARGGPDISQVRATERAGKVRITITTSNSYATGGGTTCAFFLAPQTSNPHDRRGGSIDCFGRKINNGNVGSDRPAYLAHPNAHTTVVGFALATIRGAPYRILAPKYLLVGVWTHGNADYQFDRFPAGEASQTGKWIKLQIDKRGLPN